MAMGDNNAAESAAPVIPLLSPHRPGSVAILLVPLLFFATGATGLVYQVAWQRYLLNLFGSTIYSISTVLAAFMGGLALGSIVFGQWADKLRRPLLLYGILEIMVGVAALAVPHMLRVLDPLLDQIYATSANSFLAGSVIRFLVVFVVLLIPTAIMGGTLPILSRFIAPSGASAGSGVGLLYAINTAGAFTGTIMSGFFFLRWWGVSATIAIAVAINVGVGVIALLLGLTGPAYPPAERTPQPNAAADTAADAASSATLVILAYAVSGFAALGLEVVWSRALVFCFDLLKNTTYSFTAMLAVFLVGVAAGSAVMSPFADRQRNPFRLFASFQVVIGITSIFSFSVLYYWCPSLGSEWFREYDSAAGNIRWNAAIALVFLRTAAAMFLPTFFMGMAFPVAVRAVTSATGSVGKMVGRLYAMNTVGAILGSAATGFLLLPLAGIANSIFLLGAAQVLAGVFLLMRGSAPGTKDWRARVMAVIALIALVAAFARLPRPAIFQPLDPALERLAFYREGPLATVAVVQNSLGYRTINVDNVGVAGTDPMLLTDQKSLAHVPMLLLHEPKSALTVGFGSGGASYSYTLHPDLEKIDCVEITRTVIEAAPTLVASHHDVVMYAPEYMGRTGQQPPGEPLWKGDASWFKSDPRYNIILDDARSYLRFTSARYDIIATDCTDLRYKSNANLYDLEYFKLTRDRITDDGMVVVWMPLAGLSREAFTVALRTFYRVFPDMEVFYMNNEPTHYILLIGTKRPLKVDQALIARKLQQERVRSDLAEIHLASPEKILSCFVCGREVLGRILAGKTLNTEDFPYLEFESPRYGYGDKPLLDNLDLLVDVLEKPSRLLADPVADKAFADRLNRYYAAIPHIIEGHRRYRQLEIYEAARAYLKARDANPDDPAVLNLLEFPELRRKIDGQPGNLWARWEMGRILLLYGREAEAVSQFNQIVEAAPVMLTGEDGRNRGFVELALGELEKIYRARGRVAEAEACHAKIQLLKQQAGGPQKPGSAPQ